ncbi:hypothetical protein GCM10025866_23690 [Naasia aerilata]|uniref:Uncharacterized protein n=1 Tax=Naasia aerilata TaxID=1162966 RepID=A0ABN6XS16_9MICO|nr:hypothetical protein GCM10025866_23690 [Naasia aerilata]
MATAIATRPQVVVLDEPTFGQDPGTWRELLLLLRDLLDEGIGLVAVTHDAAFAAGVGAVELAVGTRPLVGERP